MSKNIFIPLIIIVSGVILGGTLLLSGSNSNDSTRPVSARANLRKADLDIEGMFCVGCESSVEGAVGALSGVKRVDANPNTDSGTVIYNKNKITAQEIVQAPIFKTYPASVVNDAAYKGNEER